MASPKPSAHTLNVSADRLETATRWLKANTPMLREVTRDAGITAAVGLLICDDEGRLSEAALMSAMSDPEAISAAELLLSAVLR